MLRTSRKNVLAFTEPGFDPAFISINIDSVLNIATVIVRSNQSLGSVTAECTIDLDVWKNLVAKMQDELLKAAKEKL